MGQFLAIGIATEVFVKKAEIKKALSTIGSLQIRMQAQVYFNPEIYSLIDEEKTSSEYEEYYHFKLKEKVLSTQLIPFLKALYPKLYNKVEYYSCIIEELNNIKPEKWIDWAKTKPYEAFQYNEYGMTDYIKVDYTDVSIHYDCITLSLEGKIMMEAYGRQFNFFKLMIAEGFKEYSISSAIRVYLTS